MSHVPGGRPELVERACVGSVSTTRSGVRVIGPCFAPVPDVGGTVGHTLGQNIRMRVVVPNGSSVPFAPSTTFCATGGLHGGKTGVCICGNKFRRSGVVVISDLFYAIKDAGLGDHDLHCSCRIGTFVFSGRAARRLDAVFRRSGLSDALFAGRRCGGHSK